MYKILLAVDGSSFSSRATEEAIKIAQAFNGEVTVLTVAATPNISSMDLLAKVREKIKLEAQELLEETKTKFVDKGLEAKTVLEEGYPPSVICDIVENEDFDIVIVGRRGMGKFHEMVLGSVSNHVVHCANASVLVVK